MNWKEALIVGITGAASALGAGIWEYHMTDGTSGWVPLWAGLFGVTCSIVVMVLTRSWWKSKTNPLWGTWEADPGVGYIAARLIQDQRDIDTAEMILERFRNTPEKSDEAMPYVAFAGLLMRKNRTWEMDDVLRRIPKHVPIESIRAAEEVLLVLDPVDPGLVRDARQRR